MTLLCVVMIAWIDIIVGAIIVSQLLVITFVYVVITVTLLVIVVMIMSLLIVNIYCVIIVAQYVNCLVIALLAPSLQLVSTPVIISSSTLIQSPPKYIHSTSTNLSSYPQSLSSTTIFYTTSSIILMMLLTLTSTTCCYISTVITTCLIWLVIAIMQLCSWCRFIRFILVFGIGDCIKQ